ncbi:MAG: glycoside hydrolase [Blastopirellula sp.]|nr:MAG: glycoside hydrolase [Blastopirellula sp.]
MFAVALTFCEPVCADKVPRVVKVVSPNGRNKIFLRESTIADRSLKYTVRRDNKEVIDWSFVGPRIADGSTLITDVRITGTKLGRIDQTSKLPWGKTSKVRDHYSFANVSLVADSGFRWRIELRAYNDGVSFRYRLPNPSEDFALKIYEEHTTFAITGNPETLFNTLDGFSTSHESLYQRKRLRDIPTNRLLDMPFVFTQPEGPAVAITEARVLGFAGGYLDRPRNSSTTLRLRLSPHSTEKTLRVIEKGECLSPWRVIQMADSAGKLIESNLLLCLNDAPSKDFSWLRPEKTTFHWWYGAFEDDYKLPEDSLASLKRHQKYIDFCARNNIAYHSFSGDGRAWYVQSPTGYGRSVNDADILTPRPEIRLPEILKYASKKNVGIRLWVHWKPLSQNLEEAFAQYESWGVKGLMVDFLNRDDQEMIEFTERMLESAARHKLHIQIHGASKYSGEQRTYPNLFNREGVLNLEFLKWSDLCSPDHNVNVAYSRALAGPVDYHQGGFRSISRKEFQPRDHAPQVLGTRCHHLALYVVYENPMPMVSDAPEAYEGQQGFDFLKEVPTTWDETRYLTGSIGEYIVVGRRKGDVWYLGGITNWSAREISLSVDAIMTDKAYELKLYVDGSMDESKPNAISEQKWTLKAGEKLRVKLAPGGGFVGVLRPK